MAIKVGFVEIEVGLVAIDVGFIDIEVGLVATGFVTVVVVTTGGLLVVVVVTSSKHPSKYLSARPLQCTVYTAHALNPSPDNR